MTKTDSYVLILSMISRKFLNGFILVTIMVCSFSASAADSDRSPIAIGLFPPLQLPSSEYGIRGIRLSLFGMHRESQGIDLAVLGNVSKNKFSGLAIAGLFNYNPGLSTVVGLQMAALANINLGTNSVYGVQLAAYNKAGTVYGLQIGLFNVANELHGVQIGLFNINKAGPFHGSPIINASF